MRGQKWTRLACLVGLAALPLAVHGQVVISQVYGAGGNTGATLNHDYVELYNKGAAGVDLTGWSIQYTSSTGTAWTNTTALSGTIQPGGYFLIQESGGAVGAALPQPDITGTISMAAGAGKVALVSNVTALVGSCPTGAAIVDFVGYGAANCFEGAGAAPAPSATA